MSTDAYIALSVILAVVVIAVLAVALIRVRQGLDRDLGGAGHARDRADRRRGRAPAPARARGEGDQRPVRRDPLGAAGDRAQGGDRRRAEAAMTLWWIGDVVLLVVIIPVVVYLLSGVLRRPRASSRACSQIATVAAKAGSKDLDAAALLVTTRSQVEQTVAGVADYGGSLDVIVDDARRVERRRCLDAGGRGGDADRGRADRARARLLPGLDDRRAAQDHQRPRRGDRRRERDHRQERARQRDRRRRSTASSTPASTCSRACSSRRRASTTRWA